MRANAPIGRRLALAGIVGSVAALGIGARGHTRTDADRSLGVDVVGDDEAYLSLVGEGETPLGDGGTFASPYDLTIGNLFETSLDVGLKARSGKIEIDGGETQHLPAIEPGQERTVTLTSATAGDVTDTIAIEARSLDGAVLVDADRTVTFAAEKRFAWFKLKLCRGRGKPCITMLLLVLPSRHHPAVLKIIADQRLSLLGTTSLADRGGLLVPLSEGRTELDLLFDIAGSSTSGLWTVKWFKPGRIGPPAPNPGERVSAESGPVTVTVDPDATGPDSTVSLEVDLGT